MKEILNKKYTMFEKKVKERYPLIGISHEYREEDEHFMIHHDYKSWHTDNEFRDFTTDLLFELFYNDGIFNVAFVFDYKMHQLLDCTFGVMELVNFFTCTDVDATFSGNTYLDKQCKKAA